jgi:hypothetical protein
VVSRHPSELTDEPWEKITPWLPEPKPSPRGGPKPLPNRPCGDGKTKRGKGTKWMVVVAG